ncbi:MAG: adenylate cyclase, partial [bacterium]
ELGQLSEAVAVGEEERQIAETAGHPGSIAYSIMGAGYANLRTGDFTKAISVLERGLEVAEGLEIRVALNFVCSLLGRAYSFVGRHSEGLSLHERGFREAESLGALYWNSLFLAWQGESLLLAGRLEEAAECARRSLDLSRHHKERGNEAWALRLLSEIHAHPDSLDAEKADDHYRKALARAEELGMRPLVAHCRLGLGSLYGRMGRAEQARGELSAAGDLFRSMEMSFWLTRAEDTLRRVE